MNSKIMTLIQGTWVASLLLVSQVGWTCDLAEKGERNPARDQQAGRVAADVSIDKLRSPKWNNSLKGFGSLNITRGQDSRGHESSLAAKDPQWGPLRQSGVGVVTPPSFSGSLSRMASQ